MSEQEIEVIRAQGLGKVYAEGKLRTPVFDGLDLSVRRGQTVAILGASGAGKSTLLHLLGGLDTPSAGEVFVDGQKMSALSDAERGRLRNRALGFIYQFHHLLPEFTALENVMFPVVLGGVGVPDARGRARALLESVGLGHRLDHKPGELSGGERQRAAVARALVNRPGCVLGDEPTGNLDSQAREQALALTHMAQHDALTGLPNRVLFQDRLTQALAQVARGNRGAVLYIDLDKFKPINDTLGHPVGDKVLQEVAQRLRDCVREDDTVSRQGGDEFVLLLQRLADPRDAARVAEKLIRSVEQPILVDGQELRVGASVGISLFPQDSREARSLMKQADTALYHVKQTGRGRFSYFTDVMGESAETRIRTEHDLRLALAHGDFVLDYQPVAGARGGWRSIEALLRWRREDGVVTPDHFLDVAEETGLIVQIDEWVVGEACRQAKAWQRAGGALLPVSVNVSLARFDPDALVARVRAALAASGLDAQWLELEFRGTPLFAQGSRGQAMVAGLRAMGVRVAVDDIGSGQVSVEDLADHAVDALKLDLAIVGRLPDDDRARRIARAICHMGSALGYPVVAKGVESEAHRDLLVAWGCAGLQGALYSPPLDATQVAAFVGLAPGPLARRA